MSLPDRGEARTVTVSPSANWPNDVPLTSKLQDRSPSSTATQAMDVSSSLVLLFSSQRAITCAWKLVSAGLASQAARPRAPPRAAAAEPTASTAVTSTPAGPGSSEPAYAIRPSQAASTSQNAGCVDAEDAGLIPTSRHCPPKDDQAAEGRAVPADCPEMPVLARPRPGRTPVASPGVAPKTCTRAPAATARASRLSSADERADARPGVHAAAVTSAAAPTAKAPSAEPRAVSRSRRPSK